MSFKLPKRVKSGTGMSTLEINLVLIYFTGITKVWTSMGLFRLFQSLNRIISDLAVEIISMSILKFIRYGYWSAEILYEKRA